MTMNLGNKIGHEEEFIPPGFKPKDFEVFGDSARGLARSNEKVTLDSLADKLQMPVWELLENIYAAPDIGNLTVERTDRMLIENYKKFRNAYTALYRKKHEKITRKMLEKESGVSYSILYRMIGERELAKFFPIAPGYRESRSPK